MSKVGAEDWDPSDGDAKILTSLAQAPSLLFNLHLDSAGKGTFNIGTNDLI